jgi:hypothetical protein
MPAADERQGRAGAHSGAPTPAAGNNVLGAIRRLVAFGMAQTPPMLTSDPTLGVKRRKVPKQEASLPGRTTTFSNSWPSIIEELEHGSLGFCFILHSGEQMSCVWDGSTFRTVGFQFGSPKQTSDSASHPPRAASHPRRDAAREHDLPRDRLRQALHASRFRQLVRGAVPGSWPAPERPRAPQGGCTAAGRGRVQRP